MGAIADAFNSAFRDFNTDGVSATGSYSPTKSQIRSLGSLIEAGGVGTSVVTWVGAYSATTIYALGQGVSYNGAGYVSLQSNNLNNTPGPPPNAFWAQATFTPAQLAALPVTLAVAGGSGNAVSVTATPAITAFTPGCAYLLTPSLPNADGDVQVTVTGTSIAATSIRELSGSILRPGRLKPNQPYLMVTDGVVLLIIAPADLDYVLANDAQALIGSATQSMPGPRPMPGGVVFQNQAAGSQLPLRPCDVGGAAFASKRQLAAPMAFSAAASLAASATLYVGAGVSSSASADVGCPCPRNAIIKGLFAYVRLAPGGSGIVLTLYKNGAATSLTCTIVGSSTTTANDTNPADWVTVNAGDLLCVQAVNSAGATTQSFLNFNLLAA